MTKKQEEVIEEIADAAEVLLDSDYVKKDLKEKRSLTKKSLYDGSKKLKHIIPKGKRA